MDSITFILHISENTSFGRFSATALERRPIAESAMEERDIMREIIKGKGMVSDPASTGQLSLRGDLHLEIPIEPKKICEYNDIVPEKPFYPGKV